MNFLHVMTLGSAYSVTKQLGKMMIGINVGLKQLFLQARNCISRDCAGGNGTKCEQGNRLSDLGNAMVCSQVPIVPH